MDSFDSFYQELDSQALLDRHGPSLVADARRILGAHPAARVAGIIMQPESREAPALRAALAKLTGQSVPEGLLVGVFPRPMVEALLTARVDDKQWREAPWQHQQVLAVVASTRDGERFGFFPLTAAPQPPRP